MPSRESTEKYLLSYLTIRKAIGLLGMALPVVLAVGSTISGCEVLQDTISHYYYTTMGDLLVGLLSATAIFLITYKGYDNDHVYTNLAGVFALGIAFLPTSNIADGTCALFTIPANELRQTAHLVSAGAFFLVLAYISFFLFVRSGHRVTHEKRKRNLVYRSCGVIMVAMVLGIAVYYWAFSDAFRMQWRPLRPVFWMESIALWAFGISWLVKGETILKDKS
jgi:hypothetical protein